MYLPTLDAHAHLDPTRNPDKLLECGAVLAMTLSLDEAENAAQQHYMNIAWGTGCHPRFPRAQGDFEVKRFRALAEQTAIIGEVGLDTGSRVPLDLQVKTFRQVLEVVAGMPRLVSIHSYQATGLVLRELQLCPVTIPILHWWTGNVAETKKAVELGCYFSIHSQVARNSKFRLHVPPERVLLESDHGYHDPPAAIPCRIEWVEYLVAQQYEMDVEEIRRLAWRNLGRLIHATNTSHLFPKALVAFCAGAEQTGYVNSKKENT
jgi:TatD DNase family protein